jgi:hypothetical protein
MSPLSPAERKRRQRDRERAAADPARAFLNAVLAKAEEDRAAGKATARGFRFAERAAELLEAADTVEQERFWADFARRHGVRGAFAREAEDLVTRQQATGALAWANEQRVAATFSADAITAGLRGCATLLKRPTKFNRRVLEVWMARALSGVGVATPADLIGERELDADTDGDLSST